ncbi:MAG TPA: hypothetical protein VGB78_05820 [Thermoplasmata archaeon]|jgi:uncharacterized protein (DUF2062 family)
MDDWEALLCLFGSIGLTIIVIVLILTYLYIYWGIKFFRKRKGV